jgi:hypothetical protein
MIKSRIGKVFERATPDFEKVSLKCHANDRGTV